MTGQIGRSYFQTGLGEMYMVPEKQKYLEAESSILATLRERGAKSPATFKREPVSRSALQSGSGRRAWHKFCKDCTLADSTALPL